MVNILDVDCPKRIQILTLLKINSKSFPFRKVWESKHRILELCGNNGSTRVIINQFIENGIIKKIEKGYVFELKVAKEFFRNTTYAELGKQMGLGDIFA